MTRPNRDVLQYLDNLKDDAAAHIWPEDLAKCQASECVVQVTSVRMGSPSGKTVPLFSREQVVAALQYAEQQKRCEYCDGTGDVHSLDGKWRGMCTCPAGKKLASSQ